MTPWILPNRESGPQNQPSANVAVSVFNGAEASMGGIPMLGIEFVFVMAMISLSFVVFILSHAWRKRPNPKKIDIIPLRKNHLLNLKGSWASILNLLSYFCHLWPELLSNLQQWQRFFQPLPCRCKGNVYFSGTRMLSYQHTPPIVNIKERKIIAEAINHFLMLITDSFFNDAPISIRPSMWEFYFFSKSFRYSP